MKKLLLGHFFLLMIFLFMGLNETKASITDHPDNQTYCSTTSAITINFSIQTILATGESYQWQVYNETTRSWTNLVNGSAYKSPTISGATTKTLGLYFSIATATLTTAYDGTTVRCVVSSFKGIENSKPGVLTVYSPVSITSQPANATKVVGQPVTFSVGATGSLVTYQWKVDKGSGWTNITGATSSSYTIPSVATTDAGTYACEVTNYCRTLTTTNAVLTVYPVLTITKPPSDQSACEGATGVQFRVYFTGPATSFKWQSSEYKSFTWTDVGTNQFYTIPIALTKTMNRLSFRCIINGSGGQSDTSGIAILTVLYKPSIYSQPVGATKLVGEPVTFNVGATGYSLSYQWRKNSVDIQGATLSSYTIPAVNLSDAGTFSCRVYNTCNLTGLTTTGVSLTVNSPPKDAWFRQDTMKTGSMDLHVTDVDIVSESVAFATLEGSNKLMQTSDGGETWTNFDGGNTTWRCLDFVNATTGYTGGSSLVGKTTSSGSSWTTYDFTALGGTYLNDIQFLSVDSGFACGAGGFVMKTVDGGTTWTQVASGQTLVNLSALHFVNSQKGYVAGENGILLKTVDGGATWTKPSTGTINNLNEVYFITASKGFILSTSPALLRKTEDGGANWSTITGYPSIYPNAIVFTDANNGWMAGYYDVSTKGTILKTKDGGATWARQKMEGNSPNEVNDIAMINSSAGFAVGVAGQVHATNYGGCVNPRVSLYEDKTFCEGESYQLVADTVSKNLNCTYLWNPGGQTTGKLTVTTTNTYSVTVTNECGTSATDAALITFLPLPLTNAGPDLNICEGDSIQIFAEGEGVTYSWTHPEYLRDASVQYPVAGPPVGSTTFGLTITDAQGCSKTDNMVINVTARPSSDFTAPAFLCGTNQGTFTYNSSSAGKTFLWNFDEGTSNGTTGSSHQVSWAATGTKVVSLTASAGICAGTTVMKNVDVRLMPQSSFMLPTSSCASSPVSIIYTGSTSSSATYNWSYPGGTLTGGSGQGPITVSWATPGTKTVSLNVVLNGCTSPLTEKTIIAAFPNEDENLCLITVDIATGKNMIIWERTKNIGASAYKVFRETNTAGIYAVLDTIHKDSLSVFVDLTSEPETKSQKYYLTLVDTCGNESTPSDWHRPMLLTSSVGTGETSVNLSWTEYQTQAGKLQFQSYIIYRGTSASALTPIDTIPSDNTLFVDNTAPRGVTLYYRIAGVKAVACAPLVVDKKTSSGPFVHSLSNLEDNKLRGTGISDKLANSVQMAVYPNPFNDVAHIDYVLDKKYNVQVEVYNLLGERIKVLLSEEQSAGKHNLELNSSDVNYINGLYYLKIRLDEGVIVKKVMLNR